MQAYLQICFYLELFIWIDIYIRIFFARCVILISGSISISLQKYACMYLFVSIFPSFVLLRFAETNLFLELSIRFFRALLPSSLGDLGFGFGIKK